MNSDKAMLDAIEKWCLVMKGNLSADATLYNQSMMTLMVEWAKQSNFIFVGGAARSGTTYLKTILNSHSRIGCGHEMKLIPMICSTKKLWWKNMHYQLIPAGMHEEKLDNVFLCFAAMYMMSSRVDGKPRIAEKTPHNVTEFGLLHHWFPNAKFIHIIRDGRAVAASLLKQNWIDMTAPEKGKVWYCQNTFNAGKYWVQIIESAKRQQAQIPETHYLTLRYEDLINTPQETMKFMFEFLDEQWEPQILTKNPVIAEGVNKWREELSQDQLFEFDRSAGHLFNKLGYSK